MRPATIDKPGMDSSKGMSPRKAIAAGLIKFGNFDVEPMQSVAMSKPMTAAGPMKDMSRRDPLA